jgi:DNA-binding transcriptional LysR family regulator
MKEGRVQFLLCHHHDASPVRLDSSRFLSIPVGADTLLLVSAPESDGAPRFAVREDDFKASPYLGYREQSGLGRIVAAAMPGPYNCLAGRTVFQSHLAAALRSMVLTGRGVAWLPQSLIAEDLAQGRLVPAGPPTFEIDVGIYLFRPTHDLGKAAEHFWSRLARSEVGPRKH